MTAVGTTRITLCNPTAGNWDDFIRENAELARAHGASKRLNPKTVQVRRHNLLTREIVYPPPMIERNTRIGWDLYLCGAGPSLRDTYADHLLLAQEKPKADIWASNSALPTLLSWGVRRVAGFGIDQTDGLLAEWAGPPEARYIIASTVNPNLTRFLQDAGRPVTWFHNFVGTVTEKELYVTLWPPSVMVGDGLNSVNRALCLAYFMGYRRIYVLGADCALRRGAPGEYEMHANGDGALVHGATSVVMYNPVPLAGRTWYTKPDMLFSAVALAKQAVARVGLTLIGDTLPHALLDEAFRERGPKAAEAWLDDVARLERLTGIPAPGGGPEQPRGRNMVSDLFTVVTEAKAAAAA